MDPELKNYLSAHRREARYIAIGLLLFILFIAFLAWNTRQDQNELTSRTLQTNNILTQWRNADSTQQTLANTNYLTKQELLHSRDAMLDSLRKELGHSIRQVQQVTTVLERTAQRLTIPVRDTIVVDKWGHEQLAKVFTYSDPWMPRLHGWLDGDSLHLDYQVRGGVSLVYRWKPTGLFKPKELSIDLTALNPNSSVDKVQSFTIVSPVKWWQKPGVTGTAGTALGLIVGMAIK